MQASQRNIQPLIDSQLQYVIPLFQRQYSWEKKQWQTLWDDIEILYGEESAKNHFIGSIVTMQTTSVPEGVPKYLLIDGQQRLTTLFILLAALRDSSTSQREEINDIYLINRYKNGFDRYKLLPTQSDRDEFKAIIDGTQYSNHHLITKAYHFFEAKLRRAQYSVEKLKKVITSQLSVVSIVLDRDDNPYLVFESLNAKGRPLTQSDLIRNFFFMRIHPDEQEAIYKLYWQPMEVRLGGVLTEYIRHYLMSGGRIVKENEIYFTLKSLVSDDSALEELKKLSKDSEYYQRFIFPDEEPNISIRMTLKRLKMIEITTIYPLLLPCYRDYMEGRISESEIVSILGTIENYLVRRFVCNIPSNGINKVAPFIYGQAINEVETNGTSLVDEIKRLLSKKDYPKDSQFLQGLQTNRLYGGGDRRSQTRLILTVLEASFGHKELVDFEQLSIEHIMPQTLTAWWENHLGDEYESIQELHLHTLGNLTLTAYNSELSNLPFGEKSKRLCDSHLELNRYFCGVDRWTEQEIESRGSFLANKAKDIWAYFGEDASTEAAIYDPSGVTNTRPRNLVFLGESIELKTWRDVLIQTFEAVIKIDPEKIAELSELRPSYIGQDPTRFRNKAQLSNGYYIETNLSAKNIYKFCQQIISDIGLSEEDWNVKTESKD